MKEKGPDTGGNTLLFTATGGQAMELGGQLPPVVYMLKEALLYEV